MFRTPVESFDRDALARKQGRDMSKFLVQILERHLEKKAGDGRNVGED